MSATTKPSMPSAEGCLARQRVIKMAQVSDGNQLDIDCVVLDVSDTGAKLAYSAPAVVPDLVAVRLPGGKVVFSRVRWRAADTFGVEFMK
jgi:hypothetical protein